jgi:hypothetical protein
MLSSNHNNVGNFMVQSNSLAGIYIGCSLAGPEGTCSGHPPPSNYNYVFSGTSGLNFSGIQQYGIAIAHGDNFNRVVNVAATNNFLWDLFDLNSDCGSNYWFAENTIDKVTPSACIN